MLIYILCRITWASMNLDVCAICRMCLILHLKCTTTIASTNDPKSAVCTQPCSVLISANGTCSEEFEDSSWTSVTSQNGKSRERLADIRSMLASMFSARVILI